MDVESERERNRKRYPKIADFVDKVREHFPDAKVVAVREMTGREYKDRYEKLKKRSARATRARHG